MDAKWIDISIGVVAVWVAGLIFHVIFS